MIKGLIYTLTLLLSLFLIGSVLEYFGYFGTIVRAAFFWCYLAVGGALLIYYVIVPLTKMFRMGKVISYEEAARIIGQHFPEVKDKLLNLLQLQQQGLQSDDSLLAAAIAQKAAHLKPVPFSEAIDLKANHKYLKYAAIPVLLILFLLLVSPSVITESSHRIAHYKTQFERPAPFLFKIVNQSLEIPQQEDFELNVEIVGNTVPAEAFINIDGILYRMQPSDKTHFNYTFKTVQRSCTFYLEAANVKSAQYELVVYPKPAIVDFRVLLSYPTYTGKPPETLSSEGDLVVPQGTTVKWIFQTKDADSLYFSADEFIKRLVPDDNGRASLSIKALQSFTYSFGASNGFSPSTDSLSYSVMTIEDAAPMIAVVEMNDSMLDDRIFFQGRVKDDYGFSKLEFKLVKTNVNDTTIKQVITHEIGLTKALVQEFSYSTDLAEMTLAPGDQLLYYFEIWDNDGIHGPKSTKSQQFELKIPDEKELEAVIDRNSIGAQEQANRSISELKKLQEDINKLMRKLVDKKEFDWQDKKDLQELAQKQQQVKDMLQQMQQQLNENKKLEQKYKDQSEKLMEKQRELDRLMEEVLNDEMKKTLEEIDKMMKEMDKNKVQEQLEQLKLDNNELEKQLDQNLELMKRLEIEKRVEDAIQKTEKLAEKQRELSNKTDSAKPRDKESKEKLVKEQQKLEQDFQQLQQDLNQIKKDYQAIDNDLNFKLDKDLLHKIEQNQEQSEKNLEKGQNKDASSNQKEASDQLDKLSEQLAEAQLELEQQDLAEDAEQIRMILKYLVQLSFNQESLIGDVRSTLIQDPKYQTIIVNQNKVKDDFRSVEDSLRAIAKRQVNVARVISQNVADVNSNIAHSLADLLNMNQSFYGTYKNMQSATSMQYAMTSFNNLALVLAESLDQMQNQMRQNQQKKQQGSCKNPGMKKQGNCSKPGNGKPSAKSMKQMQQELNKQMESLKKQLDKQGKDGNGGRKRIGDKSSMQTSEEFARMAAQQEMIRRMMQEYGQELKQGNAGNAKLAKEIDQMMKQMEQTENDLVNRVITQQTIQRQQQIMSRMLEHEKAEMQREKEERRESREGKEQNHVPSSIDMERYQRLQESNTDLFRNVPPTLSPYYKSKVNDYFYKF